MNLFVVSVVSSFLADHTSVFCFFLLAFVCKGKMQFHNVFLIFFQLFDQTKLVLFEIDLKKID